MAARGGTLIELTGSVDGVELSEEDKIVYDLMFPNPSVRGDAPLDSGMFYSLYEALEPAVADPAGQSVRVNVQPICLGSARSPDGRPCATRVAEVTVCDAGVCTSFEATELERRVVEGAWLELRVGAQRGEDSVRVVVQYRR